MMSEMTEGERELRRMITSGEKSSQVRRVCNIMSCGEE